MSIGNWESDMEIKRKIAEGWKVNDEGYLVPPQKSSTLKKTDRDFKDRVVEAEVKNRMLLPIVAQPIPQEEKKEDEEKEDFNDTVKLATEEDVRGIKLSLKKIDLRLGNIEELLGKKIPCGVSRRKKLERD